MHSSMTPRLKLRPPLFSRSKMAGLHADEAAARILVVEDDPRICDVLEYALKADGYSVQLARRDREAVEVCKTNAPILLVLDAGLPDIDGFEACRLIRKF